MRPSQNIPLPPRIYPLSNKCMCDPTLPESPPPPPRTYLLFNNYNIMRPSQNLPLPPRIYPPFQSIYVCDNNYMRPSHPSPQNIPVFQQLYPTFPESTPPSQNIGLPPFSANVYVRPSQNLPLPPRIYPPFQQLYATLPESTPPFQNISPFQQMYVRPSQNLPPSQNIPPVSTTTCDSPRIYPSLPEYTPFSTTIILCDPPRIYPSLPESTHLFNQFMCATLPVCDVHCPCLLRRSLYPLSLQVGLDTPLHNNGKNDVYTTLYKCCRAKRRLDIRRTTTPSFELLQARTNDIELENKTQ